MSLHVLTAGLASSVQDGGRHGFAALGIGTSGAADGYSYAVGNLLVGNAPDAASLEASLLGPTLECRRAVRIAITGASIEATCDGEVLPGWRVIDLPAGSRLQLGRCLQGTHAYLAINGGIDVSAPLGSRATDLRGGFGGLEGRWLRAGDVLPLGPVCSEPTSRLRIGRRWVNPLPDIELNAPAVLRVLPGSDPLSEPTALFDQAWQVAANSGRQALRLRGRALRLMDSSERWSEPVMPGTLQLPADGQPIVLGVDAQTVGGYPRIGHVIRADWPRLAQLRQGQMLAFRAVDQAQALAAWRGVKSRLARIALAITSGRHPGCDVLSPLPLAGEGKCQASINSAHCAHANPDRLQL